MLARGLFITIFILQGLFSSAFAMPVVSKSQAAIAENAMATNAKAEHAMANCHGGLSPDSSPAIATQTDSEQCAGVCCCPGMCSSAPILTLEVFIFPHVNRRGFELVTAQAVIARPSSLYRPPNLI
ncbi:hypothetical protein QWI17_09560 [Gilvimarinus sp. SDUM040013]|uniref:CopL family metal-binding regulatory protein n=1 Tax=Gilvimarinus gilvus TaxID=3058038 RepID=A0ABU4RZT0_9GAMM|nr:hypothetical protein [Gilvimarinus sp. SDUM040013]MDO3386081.1 hypothetical protein [Gilvimarinus sp. SDUM040013]MDX6850378.1 hypothetical protein [Gilvimarinus sp. SDUM040013]